MRICCVIPAFNEQENIGAVVGELRSVRYRELPLERIVVVDNSSTDATAERAASAGAVVVHEAERGYGAACLRGIDEVRDSDIVLFVDGDGSDFPAEWPKLIAAIVEDDADLVIGSRARGVVEEGALLAHQRFGGELATFLLGLVYKTRFTDLGPFRAVRTDRLLELGMRDRDFGWTVEMQIKALRSDLRCVEVPVSYQKRRGGRSKVAGSFSGSFHASRKILSYVLYEVLRRSIELILARVGRGLRYVNSKAS